MGHENVKALVYIAAFAPDKGESLGQLVMMNPGSLIGQATTITRPYPLRHDKVDRNGKLTIRYKRLHHIGIGRRHAGETVAVLIAGRDIRVLNNTGQLIRQLELDPTRDYQAQQ